MGLGWSSGPAEYKERLECDQTESVCVCVSHPVSKGFATVFPAFHASRGQQGIHSSAANEDSCGHSVKQIGTPICVPAERTFAQAVTPIFLALIHGGSTILPPNLFPSAAFSCRAFMNCRCAQTLFETSSSAPTISPFGSITIFPGN